MPGRVVDASAIAAIVFVERHAADAAAQLNGFDLCAPSLLRFELTNVAVQKLRQAPLGAGEISEALEDGLNMITDWADIDCRQVLSIASRYDLTAYDAAYLWLSVSRGLPLVTFDSRLRAADKSIQA